MFETSIRTAVKQVQFDFSGSSGQSFVKTEQLPGEIKEVTLIAQNYTGNANKSVNWKKIGSILEVRCSFWGWGGSWGTAALTFNVYYNEGVEFGELKSAQDIPSHEQLFTVEASGPKGSMFEKNFVSNGEILNLQFLGSDTKDADSVELILIDKNHFVIRGQLNTTLNKDLLKDTLYIVASIKDVGQRLNQQKTIEEAKMKSSGLEIKEVEDNLVFKELDSGVEDLSDKESQGATFESADESILTAREDKLKITCNTVLPRIPSPLKVGKSYSIATEHTVNVQNQTGNTIKDTIYMEYEIPGVVRAWRNVEVYAKSKPSPTFFKYTVGPYSFTFKKAGTYKLYGSTRFYGEEKAVESPDITVEN